MPDEWDGNERREHDLVCDSKWKERKADLKEWVCMSTKPTRLKQGIMWTAMGLMLTFSATVAFKSYGHAGDQNALDARQDIELYHQEEKLDEMVEQQDTFITEVKEIKKDMSKIERYMGQQTQVLKALAREHGIAVDID